MARAAGSTGASPRVLVIAHDLSVTGGVNNFLSVMRRRLRLRVRVTRFINGRRKDERGKLRVVARLAGDYLRFAGLILRRRFDVLPVNPTLELKSMPRDLAFVALEAVPEGAAPKPAP